MSTFFACPFPKPASVPKLTHIRPYFLKIPKGFRPPAQGCRAFLLPWVNRSITHQLQRSCAIPSSIMAQSQNPLWEIFNPNGDCVSPTNGESRMREIRPSGFDEGRSGHAGLTTTV